MKPNRAMLSNMLPLLKNKVNLFYALAFLPLFFILYFNVWSIVIDLYGFIFLLLKNQKLRSIKESDLFHRIIGLIVIVSSFFVYYALVLVIRTAGFYSGANYVVFLLGLFLVFFDLTALKEAFSPLFFIATATASSLVATWLEPYLSPYLDDVASLLVSILRVLGINVSFYYSSGIPVLMFRSLPGSIVVASFAYWCLGVSSALIFSIILVVVLIEDPSSWQVKLLAAIVGILGTFALNIARVTIILLTDYFYGAEAGSTVHYIIGYAFFSAWLVIFLYAYSKRKVIRLKLQSIRRNAVQKGA